MFGLKKALRVDIVSVLRRGGGLQLGIDFSETHGLANPEVGEDFLGASSNGVDLHVTIETFHLLADT